jgi:hypothetical protein
MAKNTRKSQPQEDTSPAEDLDGPGNVHTEIVEFDATSTLLTPIPTTVDPAKIIQYGLDNDPFNQWEPELDESKIVQFRGVRKIWLENEKFDGLLCKFLDVQTGKILHKFLGEHLLKEFVEKQVHVTGLPILLTYKGKVRGRRREGQEVHAWSRYYYTAEEWKKLTNGGK